MQYEELACDSMRGNISGGCGSLAAVLCRTRSAAHRGAGWVLRPRCHTAGGCSKKTKRKKRETRKSYWLASTLSIIPSTQQLWCCLSALAFCHTVYTSWTRCIRKTTYCTCNVLFFGIIRSKLAHCPIVSSQLVIRCSAQRLEIEQMSRISKACIRLGTFWAPMILLGSDSAVLVPIYDSSSV